MIQVTASIRPFLTSYAGMSLLAEMRQLLLTHKHPTEKENILHGKQINKDLTVTINTTNHYVTQLHDSLNKWYSSGY